MHFLARKYFQIRPKHVLTVIKNLVDHTAIRIVGNNAVTTYETVWRPDQAEVSLDQSCKKRAEVHFQWNRHLKSVV